MSFKEWTHCDGCYMNHDNMLCLRGNACKTQADVKSVISNYYEFQRKIVTLDWLHKPIKKFKLPLFDKIGNSLWFWIGLGITIGVSISLIIRWMWINGLCA